MKDTPEDNAPMTEEEIIAATVGERKPLNGTVYIAPYDSAWPELFDA